MHLLCKGWSATGFMPGLVNRFSQTRARGGKATDLKFGELWPEEVPNWRQRRQREVYPELTLGGEELITREVGRMKRFMKLGILGNCLMASFFLVGGVGTETAHADHLFKHPKKGDSCPAAIIWNPVAGAVSQKITVTQGKKNGRRNKAD